eukprot:symbB.v1.2.037536.t1/scaffold5565.1/size25819/1
MFLAWWSVALPAAFASTCFTCCLQDGVPSSERKSLFHSAGGSYPVGIQPTHWGYSQFFTALMKISIEEKLGYHAMWQARGNQGIYALAGCTDPMYFNPETYTSTLSEKGCGPNFTRTHIVVGMWNSTEVAEAMQNIQHHYPHMLPQLYPSDTGRGFSGAAVFPSEIAAGQLVSLNLSLHSAYHADNKLALAQVFSKIADVDVSKLVRCEDVQMSEEYLQNYLAVTGDRDGGFHSNDTACPGGYFWLAPSCRSSSSTCIPFLHTSGSIFRRAEMMQKAAFWNIPIAIAAVSSYTDYFNIVQGYKTIFDWYFPEHRQLAESPAGDPKLILFPMGDASSYLPGNYTLNYGPWDGDTVTGVSKELSSLAPAVDSFVSKVSFTMEQLIEIVRQHKQFIDGAYLAQSDEMYSLACDRLKNNADALEFWLVTTSTTTGPTTTTTASTTATGTTEATTSGSTRTEDDTQTSVAMGSRDVLDVFLFSMLCLKAAGMSIE